ncbi:MAG: hypothetical protein GXY83_07080, partial [Rhodopirellula sp.]|nr:hypothetical protein [Rhodopirellula sp.]
MKKRFCNLLMPARKQPHKIDIITAAHVAIIPAAVAELVARLLTADAPGITDTQLLKASVSNGFFERDDRDRLCTWAGLVPRIRKHLERLGHQVTVDDLTTWLQYEQMDSSCLHSDVAGAEEESLFAALAANPRGQIVVNNERQVARTIALVTVAFPELNVLAVARNRKERDRLHRAVCELVDGNVCRCDDFNWHSPRLLIATPFTFGVCFQRDWDIVIFTDATVALTEWASQRFNLMQKCFFFA